MPPAEGDRGLFVLKQVVKLSDESLTFQASDIKAHSFFKGVKWDQMLELSIPPPFIPDIDGPHSLKYVRPKYLEQVRTSCNKLIQTNESVKLLRSQQ